MAMATHRQAFEATRGERLWAKTPKGLDGRRAPLYARAMTGANNPPNDPRSGRPSRSMQASRKRELQATQAMTSRQRMLYALALGRLGTRLSRAGKGSKAP